MFGIGTPEMVGIALVVFLIYGPDKLPHVIKKIVGFLREIKNMTDEVSTTVSKEIHRIEKDVRFEIPEHSADQRQLPAKDKPDEPTS